MNKRILTRIADYLSGNLKSKIKNPKWAGLVAIVLTFVMCGAVA